MTQTTLIIYAISLLLGMSNLHAKPSAYEYKVASTEFAAFAFDKASEAIVKKWAQKHRPGLYKLCFAEKKKVEKKDDKAMDGFAVAALSLAAKNDLYLDYYLNQQAEDGWEPFKMEEKTILLRRERQRD